MAGHAMLLTLAFMQITPRYGGSAPLSNFYYASVLTEAMLLGNVAIRMGIPIEYDGQKARSRITQAPPNSSHRRRVKDGKSEAIFVVTPVRHSREVRGRVIVHRTDQLPPRGSAY